MRKRLGRAAEVREVFDLPSDARVNELARQGLLPGVVRLGRCVRFDMEKISEFIEKGGRALPGGWRRQVP